jgi:hypothetical protein
MHPDLSICTGAESPCTGNLSLRTERRVAKARAESLCTGQAAVARARQGITAAPPLVTRCGRRSRKITRSCAARPAVPACAAVSGSTPRSGPSTPSPPPSAAATVRPRPRPRSRGVRLPAPTPPAVRPRRVECSTPTRSTPCWRGGRAISSDTASRQVVVRRRGDWQERGPG